MHFNSYNGLSKRMINILCSIFKLTAKIAGMEEAYKRCVCVCVWGGGGGGGREGRGALEER